MRYMVVDDNEDNLRMLDLVLRNDNHHVSKARNGREALDIARRLPPDIVISDILMPVMDGFALCQAWHEDEELRRIPFVFYTATYVSEEDEAFALSLGARAFIRKPTEPSAFLARIEEILGGEPSFSPAKPSPSLPREDFLKLYNERLIDKLEQRSEKLARSEERYRTIIENTSDGYYEVDLRGNFTFFSDAYARMLGYRPDEMMGMNYRQYMSSQTAREIFQDFNRIYRTGEPLRSAVYQFLRKGGEALDVEASAVLIVGPGGEPQGFQGVISNITERKKAEEALRASEARFRSLFEQNVAGVYRSKVEAGVVECNEAFARMFGYDSPEEASRQSVENFYVDAQESERFRSKLIRDGEVRAVETHCRRKDGTAFWVLENASLIRDDATGETFIEGTCIDITELKAAEADRNLLFTAIEQSHDSVVITDPEGAILYVNSAFENLTGYSRQEALGRNPRILKSGKHDQDFYRKMWQTILAGNVWTGTIVNRKKDGSLFTELTTVSPVQADSGLLRAFVAVKRDVSAEEEMRGRLAQAQKMESIGKLAGGVAHDFNNLLAVMMSQAELALLSDDLPTTVRDRFEQIQAAISSAADLTRQLLMFARKQRIAAKKVDINAAVEETLKMLRRLIGEDIALSWRPHPGLWPVWIDPSQIDQILANLCVNARDAIAGVGKVTVETANRLLDEAVCKAHDVEPGEWVALTVSDDGVGMSQEVLEHIFEPFFTTKELGHGTGLGLATVHGIAAQNGGFVDVVSEPDKGSKFTVFLPKWKGEESVEVNESTTPTSAQGSGETLLLVEDDPTILETTLQILEALGYRVLAAATPAEAVRIADEHPGAIDLLVTDVVMPEMNGHELSKHLQARRPGLPVLFMSGYPANIAAKRGVLDGDVAFLQKPFTVSQLSEIVRSTLEAADA